MFALISQRHACESDRKRLFCKHLCSVSLFICSAGCLVVLRTNICTVSCLPEGKRTKWWSTVFILATIFLTTLLFDILMEWLFKAILVPSSLLRVMEHVRPFLSDSSGIWHNISSCSLCTSYFCPAFFQFLYSCFLFDFCFLTLLFFLLSSYFITNPSLPPHNNSHTIDELYAQKLKYKAISEELDHALNDMTSM